MLVNAVFGPHDNTERPAHADIEESIGRHDVPGAHPFSNALRINPGLVYDFTWCRHSAAHNHAMLAISGLFHALFLSLRPCIFSRYKLPMHPCVLPRIADSIPA